MAVEYRKRVKRFWKTRRFSPTGRKVGVLITPWMGTPVPFFSLECGLALRDAGEQVSFIWDTKDVFANARSIHEIREIKETLKVLPKGARVLAMGECPADGYGNVRFSLEELSWENAVWLKRGEKLGAEFLDHHPSYLNSLERHAARVQRFLQFEKFDWILIPGGIWALSGLYTKVADSLGVSYTCYDSGPKQLCTFHNGPAAHFPNTKQAWTILKSRPLQVQRDCVSAAQEILQSRMEGKDAFRLQPKPVSELPKEQCDILLTLNYRPDTAALCRCRVFPSVTDWVRAVCEWVDQRKDVVMVIRQHPCEKIPSYRGTDEWEDLLGSFSSFGKSIRLAKAEDDVNTYDLLLSSRVVLPFTSRMGIEAAMLGKPVVLGADCYYQNCGFTLDAKNSREYFSFLDKAINGAHAQTKESSFLAALFYYIVEKCVFLDTEFTPCPTDFMDWVQVPPDQLWHENFQKIFFSSIFERKNVSLELEEMFFSLSQKGQ